MLCQHYIDITATCRVEWLVQAKLARHALSGQVCTGERSGKAGANSLELQKQGEQRHMCCSLFEPFECRLDTIFVGRDVLQGLARAEPKVSQ